MLDFYKTKCYEIPWEPAASSTKKSDWVCTPAGTQCDCCFSFHLSTCGIIVGSLDSLWTCTAEPCGMLAPDGLLIKKRSLYPTHLCYPPSVSSSPSSWQNLFLSQSTLEPLLKQGLSEPESIRLHVSLWGCLSICLLTRSSLISDFAPSGQ